MTQSSDRNFLFDRPGRELRLVALLVITTFLLMSSAFAAQTLTVCASGCNFTDLKLAVDVAQSGDTIRIRAGFYPIAWTRGTIIGIADKSLKIKGDGPNSTVIQIGAGGGITQRATAFDLNCTSLSEVTIADLALTSLGVNTGIANEGCRLHLNNVLIENQGDGGIYNDGTLVLESSVVAHNKTIGRFATGQGGGILNGANGVLRIKDGQILDNSAGNGGGGGIANYGGSVEIVDSTIARNVSIGGFGGGVYNDSGTIILRNVHVLSNSIEFAGFRLTHPQWFNRGAGICIQGGKLHLLQSIVDQNTPYENDPSDGCMSGACPLALGGGVFVAEGSTFRSQDSLIMNNRAYQQGNGAGLYSEAGSTVRVRDTLVVHNVVDTEIDNCDGPGFSCVAQ